MTLISYDPFEASKAVNSNTADTLSVIVPKVSPPYWRALISAQINIEGVGQTGVSAFKYILALRSTPPGYGGVAAASNTVIPLAEGWIRRGGWTPGANATTVNQDEGGVRWQGFEPLDPSRNDYSLECYIIGLNGAAATFRLRGMTRTDGP